MNTNKQLKPNLVNPIVKEKIIRTLNPPKEDYWAPTKNVFQSFYQNYIKPNIYLILFLIFLIVLLVYRYRIIKSRKTQNKSNTDIANKKDKPENINDEYIDAAFQIYKQQKDEYYEPKLKSKNKSGYAYPMFPYQDGTLMPPGSR